MTTITEDLRQVQRLVSEAYELIHPVQGAIIGEAVDRLARAQGELSRLAQQTESEVDDKTGTPRYSPIQRQMLLEALADLECLTMPQRAAVVGGMLGMVVGAAIEHKHIPTSGALFWALDFMRKQIKAARANPDLKAGVPS
jgi:hypothetical protein